MIRIIMTITFLILYNFINAQDEIYVQLAPKQCDSLINANFNNPNFVILDVRTPQEYDPQHLKGAINRNYYDTDFDSQLDSLNEEKVFLLHCRSGSRSAKAFEKMKTKLFKEVYEMEGGILAWISDSLSTTMDFAPRIALVSDSLIPHENILIGEMDTIAITITNRENDTLIFNSITEFDGNHFSTDFNIDSTLQGADDYTFNIFHEPSEESHDSLVFVIESNGGNVEIFIERTDYIISKSTHELSSNINIFPNPATDYLKVEGLQSAKTSMEIIDLNGKLVNSKFNIENNDLIDLSSVKNGMYFVKFFSKNSHVLKKLIINRN